MLSKNEFLGYFYIILGSFLALTLAANLLIKILILIIAFTFIYKGISKLNPAGMTVFAYRTYSKFTRK
ncbi:MAG: hypothetical protein UR26_C0002G0193 [candidate division TM6 bacterium GW2011_GWF2_32_72]|nr:MAG: hypothetical protein UR26_C0002G0193 [candidate division TM6 bacterium GW2011_GWF2_32_72]